MVKLTTGGWSTRRRDQTSSFVPSGHVGAARLPGGRFGCAAPTDFDDDGGGDEMSDEGHVHVVCPAGRTCPHVGLLP